MTKTELQYILALLSSILLSYRLVNRGMSESDVQNILKSVESGISSVINFKENE